MSSFDAVAGVKCPSTARRSDWSGPFGRNSHTDKSASAHDRAELLTDAVSGTLRRNVLGAIAPLKRTIATSRRNDNRNESRPSTINHMSTNNDHQKMRLRKALPVRTNPDGNRSRLTNSLRNGRSSRVMFSGPDVLTFVLSEVASTSSWSRSIRELLKASENRNDYTS